MLIPLGGALNLAAATDIAGEQRGALCGSTGVICVLASHLTTRRDICLIYNTIFRYNLSFNLHVRPHKEELKDLGELIDGAVDRLPDIFKTEFS